MSRKRKIIIALIAIIIFLVIILVDNTYKEDKYLTCTYELSNYSEKMIFYFNQNILFSFERDEYTATSVSNHDSLLEKYENKLASAEDEMDSYFTYTVTEVDGGIKAHTYIYLPKHSTLFNSYFDSDEYGITRISSLSEIKSILEAKNFTCKES